MTTRKRRNVAHMKRIEIWVSNEIHLRFKELAESKKSSMSELIAPEIQRILSSGWHSLAAAQPGSNVTAEQFIAYLDGKISGSELAEIEKKAIASRQPVAAPVEAVEPVVAVSVVSEVDVAPPPVDVSNSPQVEPQTISQDEIAPVATSQLVVSRESHTGTEAVESDSVSIEHLAEAPSQVESTQNRQNASSDLYQTFASSVGDAVREYEETHGALPGENNQVSKSDDNFASKFKAWFSGKNGNNV